jgi:hypothetical protein
LKRQWEIYALRAGFVEEVDLRIEAELLHLVFHLINLGINDVSCFVVAAVWSEGAGVVACACGCGPAERSCCSSLWTRCRVTATA